VFVNLKKEKKITSPLSKQPCSKFSIKVEGINQKAQKCGEDICTGIKKIVVQKVGSIVK